MVESKGFSVGRIVRGGFWLYFGSIIDNLSGFVYWMLMSMLVGPAALGIASAISNLSGLILNFVGLGMGTGALRFFGMYFGGGDDEKLRTYFWSTYFLNILIHVAVGVALLSLGISSYGFGGISRELLIFTSFMVIAGLNSIPSALITSTLRTEIIFTSIVLSTLLRFAVGVALTYGYGLGWVGAVIGNLTQLYSRLIVINLNVLKKVPLTRSFSYRAIREVLIAGIPSWVPSIVASLGSSLGVISVYFMSGASETGYYYISLAIANVILMIGTTLLSLTFPVLSGMSDGRKRALSQVMKVSIAFIAPPSIYVMIYSWLPLSLLGRAYVDSAPMLTVLLISAIPLTISSGVMSLTYAYGKYLLVLASDTAVSIVRIVLYYMLIPNYGGLGSAIAFTAGSLAQLLIALYVAKIVKFTVRWRTVAEVVAIPLTLGGLCFILGVHWLVALAILASSYLTYLKLRIISREELKEIIKALHMEPLAIKVYSKYGDVINRMLGY